MTTLSAEGVNDLFRDCLFRDGEDTSNHIKAAGITVSVGFHPGRLQAHRDTIIDMLNQLPEAFHQGKGEGSSFLNACLDKHGHQWTGLQRTMQELFLLGIGIGKVESLLPPEYWYMLPGGIPYYIILP